MAFKVFYSDYCEEKIIDSSDAFHASVSEILHSMDCVLHVPKNFIGIIDERDITLQFYVNDDKSILIDVPMPEKNGSFCRAGSLQECLSIVKRLDKAVDVSKIDGLEFQSW